MLLRLALTATVVGFAAGCGSSGPDLSAAREFDRFPLYWVGERFEQWDLTTIDGLDYPSQIISFIYGNCEPHDGEQPSCTPPFQIQVSPACAEASGTAPAPEGTRRIRGAPVGTIDNAPVLFTRGAQIKVYRGKGSYPGLAVKVLRALRSANSVPPVITSTDPIPPPAPGVLEGTAACGH